MLWELGGKWEVEEVELDPPGPGEVLVELAASGLCHSVSIWSPVTCPSPSR